MLARVLSPILNIKRSEKALEAFGEIFTAKYTQLLRDKLRLEKEDESDLTVIKHLLDLLESKSIHYTAFVRLLSHYNGTRTELLALDRAEAPMSEWLDDYDKHIEKDLINIETKKCWVSIQNTS